MAELKISLRRIAEDGFTKNDEILADTSKVLHPQMGFELMSDIKKNLLTIVAQVGFTTPEKEIDYKFPQGFLEAVLTDVYATARVLLAQKLVGTRLEGAYLPFGGASELIKLTKKY